ncbi:MAG: hypothetical protein JRN62_00330 [Nitrososphaerota archaeon]|nr:hypothetical protein [Nitrososphaerota archaeon]
MRTRVELRIDCRDGPTVRSLVSVLAPDNEGAPRGMKLASAVNGEHLAFAVESDSASSSLSTALAVLRDATLFQEVWLLSQPKRG